MALFNSGSRFKQSIVRREFYDAYMEYVNVPDECEPELEKMIRKNEKNAQAFADYLLVWQMYCEKVLEGEFEAAKEALGEYNDALEFGEEQQRTILGLLAETTSNFNAYLMFKTEMMDEDELDDIDYAITVLVDYLPDCPEAFPESNRLCKRALEMLGNKKKSDRVYFMEYILKSYGKPGTDLYDEEAFEYCKELLKLDRKSKIAEEVDKQIIQSDILLKNQVRDDVLAGEFEKALITISEQNPAKPKRIAFRGVWDSIEKDKDEAFQFMKFGYYVADKLGTAEDYFYAASSAWGPMSAYEDAVASALDYGMKALELAPDNIEYKKAALDGLYLLRPFPMKDEDAMRLAKEVLEVEPENHVALECVDIAEEEMAKKEAEA